MRKEDEYAPLLKGLVPEAEARLGPIALESVTFHEGGQQQCHLQEPDRDCEHQVLPNREPGTRCEIASLVVQSSGQLPSTF